MKVLFIDSVHPVLSERLTMAGHTCEDVSELNGEALLVRLHDAEGLVIRGRVVLDAKALDRSRDGSVSGRTRAGRENVPQ